MTTHKFQVNLWADPECPTDPERAGDFELERIALFSAHRDIANLAAYALGARESHVTVKTNLNASIHETVPEWYERGREHYQEN